MGFPSSLQYQYLEAFLLQELLGDAAAAAIPVAAAALAMLIASGRGPRMPGSPGLSSSTVWRGGPAAGQPPGSRRDWRRTRCTRARASSRP